MGPVAGMVAAIVTASEQAEADKFIATTSANAAIAQTTIQSETTRFLAQNQKQISEQNLAVTREIAQQQEDNATNRLQIQLAALEKERRAQEQERSVIRDIEQKRLDEQLELVREQVDQQLQVARLQINTQILQQAINGNSGVGAGAGINSNRIAVTQTGISGSNNAGSLQSTSGSINLNNANFGSNSATLGAGNLALGGARTLNSTNGARGITPASLSPKQASSAHPGSRSLLNSVSSRSSKFSSTRSVGASSLLRFNDAPRASSRGVLTSKTLVQKKLPTTLSRQLRGITGKLVSTRKKKNLIERDEEKRQPNSDLASWMSEVEGKNRFSEYLAQQPVQNIPPARSGHGHGARGNNFRGAYNAPRSVAPAPSSARPSRGRSLR